MYKLKKIKRVRVSEEIAKILEKMPNESEFIRTAIKEKLQKEKIIKKEKLPF